MNSITYLIGAGASYNAVPIVKEIPSRLDNIRAYIHNHRLAGALPYENISIRITGIEAEDHFLRAIDELKVNLENHDSIDTYAKKLFLIGDFEKYKTVKAILSTFLIYEQYIKPVDRRYDSFFSAILQKEFTALPSNVQIVSWNYDYQFELAYSLYTRELDLLENQRRLGVTSLKYSFGNGGERRFRIFKLNGTTGYFNKSGNFARNLLNKLGSLDEYQLCNMLMENYVRSIWGTDDFQPLLSFAWENPISTFSGELARSLGITTALVVIGYSFPFFNREIDRQILYFMQDRLKKIYIQDIAPKNVRDSLMSAMPDGLEIEPTLIDSCNQFYLPREL